jgi:putative SOS response-associated peptidase YedK
MERSRALDHPGISPSLRRDSIAHTLIEVFRFVEAAMLIIPSKYAWHMCGRYALAASQEEIITQFEINSLSEKAVRSPLPVDWNIAPTKSVYLIKGPSGDRSLDIASWGLIAPWSKSREEASRSQSMAINARVETVHEKPTFRQAFKTKRCLIPATGYYEWATELGQYPRKQPIFITSDEDRLLAFTGIYSFWRDPSNLESGENEDPATLMKQSVAIITRDAVGDLAKVHNRMPLFLPRDRWDRWLDIDTPEQELKGLLDVSAPDSHLRFWPVESRVNSIRNNGRELILPIDMGESETLF